MHEEIGALNMKNKATILIVEDDYIVARMLEKTLAELGYIITGMASNGPDAIRLTGQHHPSLVLLDIRLGGSMDGIEAAKEIYKLYKIPVVYITAHSDDPTFTRAIETALYGYLIKPVTINTLRTTIEVALEKYRIEESLRQANKKLALLSSITRHDILNTLTALMGAVDIALMSAKDPEFVEHLRREEHLLSQVRRQIEFTRDYESLGLSAPVWHDLNVLITKTAHQILPENVHIETSVGNIQIFADPIFEKVIYNLLDNSIRHGKSVTAIRFTAREEPGTGLTIVCEDNGSGIVTEEKDRIFDRGFGKNTGLGLFLVREILEMAGSSIRETGMPGVGARFEITIPPDHYRAVKT